MAKQNYKNLSKEELIKEIERLKKRKKYGLVWEEKKEEVVEMCKEKSKNGKISGTMFVLTKRLITSPHQSIFGSLKQLIYQLKMSSFYKLKGVSYVSEPLQGNKSKNTEIIKTDRNFHTK